MVGALGALAVTGGDGLGGGVPDAAIPVLEGVVGDDGLINGDSGALLNGFLQQLGELGFNIDTSSFIGADGALTGDIGAILGEIFQQLLGPLFGQFSDAFPGLQDALVDAGDDMEITPDDADPAAADPAAPADAGPVAPVDAGDAMEIAPDAAAPADDTPAAPADAAEEMAVAPVGDRLTGSAADIIIEANVDLIGAWGDATGPAPAGAPAPSADPVPAHGQQGGMTFSA